MKPQDYLQAVLEAQNLGEDSDKLKALQEERKRVEELLRNSFKGSNPTIRYGGSMAKGTMIKESYDLDIICYFKYDDNNAGDSLEDIYNNVRRALQAKYRVVPKRSALHLESSDPKNFGVYFHIDVIPGRYTDQSNKDAFLYQSTGEKKYLKTNLQRHIDHVKKSGLVATIKLLKFWKVRNGLPITTFALELLVIKCLPRLRDASGLATCLQTFWTLLRDKIDDINIEDPANPTGNDLSHLLNDDIRRLLSTRAAQTLELIGNQGWEAVFGQIKGMEPDEKLANIQVVTRQRSTSPNPWSNCV